MFLLSWLSFGGGLDTGAGVEELAPAEDPFSLRMAPISPVSLGVQGLGFRVQGFRGLGVEGLGFRVYL